MKDERIEKAIKETRSEIAIILYIVIIISFLVKRLIFDMNLQGYITEFAIMIFFPIYQFIRLQTMKTSFYKKGTTKYTSLFLVIITMGVIFIGLIYYVVPKSSGVSLILMVYLAISVALSFGVNKFNEYRAHKYEKEFDDDM